MGFGKKRKVEILMIMITHDIGKSHILNRRIKTIQFQESLGGGT